jgi:hypothetical protein
VRRPPASVVFEGYVIWRVPVSRSEQCRVRFPEHGNVIVKKWNHLVAFRHGQSAAGTEIVLHIHNNQRVSFAYAKFFFQQHHPSQTVTLS